MYDVKKVIEQTVLDCLHSWDDEPLKVPPILHLKAAVGGDVSTIFFFIFMSDLPFFYNPEA